MSSKVSPTLKVLLEIRDEIRDVRDEVRGVTDEVREVKDEVREVKIEVRATNERLDRQVDRLDGRVDSLDERMREGFGHVTTGMAAVVRSVDDVRDLLRDRLDQRELVADHERRIVELERKVS